MRCYKQILVGLVVSSLVTGGVMAQDVVRIGGIDFIRQNFKISDGQPDLLSAAFSF